MKQKMLLGVMALSLFVLFGLRVDFLLRTERANAILPQENVTVVGQVVNDPEERENSLHATVELASGGKLLAILPRSTQLSYGDRVVLEGNIAAPESFVTDTGRIFDYEGYLRVRGISALMHYGEIKEHTESGPTFFGTLYKIKHSFKLSLERVLPEPQAALFEGILLGERRGLPEALTTAFIVASLIHIVVLSGYNISIVGEAVLRGLSFLPRGVSFVIGGILMFLFVLMTGLAATSVRACVMALIAILARYMHRPAAALRALFLAAGGMIFWNPLIVLYDPGFVLSVVATFGLVTLGNVVEKRLPKFLSAVPQVRSVAASTIAVQLYLLPALLYFTGVLSFVGLPANILALPLIPLTMLLGFLSGVLGLVHSALAFVPAFATDMLLRYLITVAQWSASLPLSYIVVPAFPAWVVLVAYVPLSALAIFLYQRNVSRTQTS